MQVKKGFDEHGKAYSFTEFQLGDLPLAMKNGWVYLADEIDRAQPEVLSAYQSVLEGQPLHLPEADEDNRVIIPHPDFRFVATGNSNGMGDETGIHRAVQRQDAATFERFSIVMQLEYLNKEDEVAMVQEKAGVSGAHAEKLRTFAEKIRSQFPHEFPLTIGPRVLIKIGRLGRLKGNFSEGVLLAYANRLPEVERKAAMDLAARVLG
jgi:cobaltochelatase CobS